MNEQMQNILAARDHIQIKTSIIPQIAIVLGSGLGALADEVQADAVVPFTDIPGFAQSTVSGHGVGSGGDTTLQAATRRINKVKVTINFFM